MSIDTFLFGFAALAFAAIIIHALTSDRSSQRRGQSEKSDD
jgi:hypothetical protein